MTTTTVTIGNWTGPLDVAANLMDEELRERVHADGVEDPQAFADAYCAKHRQRFGADFVVS